MAHIVHCRICKAAIDVDKQKDWIMPAKNWYYHKTCYENFGKKKGAIKEGDLMVEADDDLWRSAVYDYLKKDLKMGLNYVKFLSQWNNFLKKDMTAKGIYFTLRYFYEVQHGNLNKSENGIGIVPFVYKEGTKYWAERDQRDKGICAKIEQQILKSKTLPVSVILQKRKEKTKPVVDLSVIAEMEDEEDC